MSGKYDAFSTTHGSANSSTIRNKPHVIPGRKSIDTVAAREAHQLDAGTLALRAAERRHTGGRIHVERTPAGRAVGLVLLAALGVADSRRHVGAPLRHEAGVWRRESGRLCAVRHHTDRRLR